jgi:hypothetical protein
VREFENQEMIVRIGQAAIKNKYFHIVVDLFNRGLI